MYNILTTRIDDLTNRCIIGRIAFLEDNLFANPPASKPSSPKTSGKGEKQKSSHPSVDETGNDTYQNEEQFAENIWLLKSQQKDIITEASRILLPSQGDDEWSFHGFNTVFDEIKAIKTLIESNKKTYFGRLKNRSLICLQTSKR